MEGEREHMPPLPGSTSLPIGERRNDQRYHYTPMFRGKYIFNKLIMIVLRHQL